MQEVYIKAHIAESKQEVRQPKGFLFSIAKNLALNELNRKSRQMTDYIEDSIAAIPVDKSPTIESEVEAAEVLNVYCEAVAALPERCRQVYILRKVNGLKQKEIAKRLNISLSSVEKNLKIGVVSCKNYIEAHDKDANTSTEVQLKKVSK